MEFPTATAIQSASLSVSDTYIRTAGYAAVGDGGDALYARVGVEPSHGGKVQSTDGAWWEIVPLMGALSIRQFGASPTNTNGLNTSAIQAALRCAESINCGKVIVPGGTYRVGKSLSETYQTFALPTGKKDQYSIIVPSGITLEGTGKNSILKRDVPESLVVVLVPNSNASQVRNLRVDGNNTEYPIDGPTFGSGAGVFVESDIGTEDKENIIDTVWIEDTPGYGIGCEWGNHRGLTIRNIFIDGCGSDGIDLKRMNYNNSASSFDCYGVTVDNIHVTNFGRTASDDALQAGIDLRGIVTATNLHVYGDWGARAQTGVRLRGGFKTDNAIGAQRSSVSNYYVEKKSGGAPLTYGVEVNADDCSTSNGTVSGVHTGVGHILAGNAVDMRRVQHSNVHAVLCSIYGFRTSKDCHDVAMSGCSAYSDSAVGFRLEGKRNSVVVPSVCQNSGNRIEVSSDAVDCTIVQPKYSGSSQNFISDLGSNTKVI